jgi:hypothetical protein
LGTGQEVKVTNRISSLCLETDNDTAILWEDNGDGSHVFEVEDIRATVTIDHALTFYGSVESWAAFWLLYDAGATHVLESSDPRDLRKETK